jgi:hypothetical protein
VSRSVSIQGRYTRGYASPSLLVFAWVKADIALGRAARRRTQRNTAARLTETARPLIVTSGDSPIASLTTTRIGMLSDTTESLTCRGKSQQIMVSNDQVSPTRGRMFIIRSVTGFG